MGILRTENVNICRYNLFFCDQKKVRHVEYYSKPSCLAAQKLQKVIYKDTMTELYGNQALMWCVKLGHISVLGSIVGPDYYYGPRNRRPVYLGASGPFAAIGVVQ